MFKISRATLNDELVERIKLIEQEHNHLTELDREWKKSEASYVRTREKLSERIKRQHDEIIEIKNALILLEDAPAHGMVSHLDAGGDKGE